MSGVGKIVDFRHLSRRSLKRCNMGSKLLLTTNRIMYTRFRLVPKSMTLNHLWAKFKVIDSLNAAKMAKYSLVITPTPCRVAGCIISVRRIRIHAPVHLLTFIVGSGRTISPKRLKIERKLLLTSYIGLKLNRAAKFEGGGQFWTLEISY